MAAPDSKSAFRVLSLDGGGMRGLYTAALLEHLTGQLHKNSGVPDIGKGFDLIVGTSTGGILACALAVGLPIGQIIDLYVHEGPSIFTNPVPQGIERLLWICKNTFNAANEQANLRSALKTLFKEKTIGQVYQERKIALCIPSVKLLKETARVFKTGHNPEKRMDDDLTLVDVCLATSAAPIILPLAEVKNKKKENEGVYVDGGLWANNPVLIGVLEALSMTEKDVPIEIISLGTCGAPGGSVITPNHLNRGLFSWQGGVGTMSVSMNAQASGAAYMTRFLQIELERLGKRISYVRIPQGSVSADQIKFLGMDMSNKTALNLFKELGVADATEALRTCQSPMTDDGEVLKKIFENFPILSDSV